MKLATRTLRVRTKGPGFSDITSDVRAWVREQAAKDGQLTLFVRHTSASLVIQENADPDVLGDLQRFMERIAPWDAALYAHTTEGADDMPAHIRSALTQTAITIPVLGGEPVLGTWQAIYLWEHRARGSTREIVLQLLC
ncbi:MAG: YjbQ family protein [Alphaproteobacteria bacterium]|nr:YjbQ family protein [Alphaproteobacteria bacterium]